MKTLRKLFIIALTVVSMAIIGAAATGCSQTCGLNYAAERGGYIDGIAEQTVDVGGDGSGVEAVPYYGFVFVEWSDGVKAARREDKAVQSDINVTAIFHKKAIDVTYVAYGNGTISGNASQSVEWGGDAEEVTAVPDNGYVFIEWSDGVKDATRKDTEVIGDKVVKAVFVKKSYNVRYLSDGNGAVRDNKSLHKDYIQSVKYLDSAASVTAVPDEGYEFVEWSDGSKEITRTDKNVQNDMAIIAYFAIKEFTLEYDRGLDPSEGRVINGAKQRVEYGQNGHEVSAIPNEGYDFVEWSDGVKTQDRRDENIKQNIEVKPVFVRKEFTLEYEYGLDPIEGRVFNGTQHHIQYGTSGSKAIALPNDDYEFVEWSDGVKTRERRDENIKENIKIKPIFVLRKLRVQYGSSIGGYVYSGGERITLHLVERGNDTEPVKAIPNDGYVFLYWSDGVETAERNVKNVTCDMWLTAYFGYSMEYKVNNGIGGKLRGEISQKGRPGVECTEVEAIPDEGYVFCGWSDSQFSTVRRDTIDKYCRVYAAYFEPKQKTFALDYGMAVGSPMQNSITIERDSLIVTGYATPSMQGYSFEGWYADKDYKLKVITGDGIYMLGYYGFALETDTLYARWKSADDTNPVFKILLLGINEINAKLYPAKYGAEQVLYDVHYAMTAVEREYLEVVQYVMYDRLNEWLTDTVAVEVDLYFTTESIDERYIKGYRSATSGYYMPAVSQISVMESLYNRYNSIITMFGLGENYRELVGGGHWLGLLKYQDIRYDELDYYYSRPEWYSNLKKAKTVESIGDRLVGFDFMCRFVDTCISLYSHDAAIYNVERYYKDELHIWNDMVWCRDYIKGIAEYYGEKVGIPNKFWTADASLTLPMNENQAIVWEPANNLIA